MILKKKKNLVFLSFFIILLPLFFLHFQIGFSYGVAESVAEKNVLILESYHRGHPWTDAQENAIFDELEKSDLNIVTFIEEMDWKRYPDKQNLSQLHERFQYKYMNMPIDLIMTTDDAALQFALDHRVELFSNAPIVFSGVLKKDADRILEGKINVTGTYEQMNSEGTVQFAKKVFPDLKYVYLLHDLSDSGVSTGELMKNGVCDASDDLVVRDLSNLSLNDILKLVPNFSMDSIILVASYNFDADNHYLAIDQSVKKLSEKSSVPVFTLDEAAFGTGALGGDLNSGLLHGKTAAELGLRILVGESANQIPISEKKPACWSFDYDQMKRFHVELDELPNDAVVIHKSVSYYEQNKTIILSNIAVLIALILFIIYLLTSIRYRKKIEVMLKEQKDKIYHLAYYSPVTDLPNRVFLRETLETYIAADPKHEKKFALVYIDIDNFKEINDTFGHSVGDQVLLYFAERLKKAHNLQNNNSLDSLDVFSLGGDEFIMLFYDTDKQKMDVISKDMVCTITEPFVLEDNIFYMEVSGGIVFYPDHGTTYSELLKNSDTAMYRSKEAGKGIFTYFNQSMSDDAFKKNAMQSNLRLSIERGDFVVYYQPQMDAKTWSISGFEALIRWNSPEFGFVQPLSFMKIAEESRLIIPIGEWVLETACSFMKRIHREFSSKYIISVNISVIQLLQEDFVDMVMDTLKKTGISPQSLELEITETVFLNSSKMAVDTLERLKQTGVKVALDDFGTGYSSLSYLSQLPISTLKIDKAFISSLFDSNKNMVLTNSIIRMGHELGLELVIEGVETDEQKELFTLMGCDRIQGYLVGKPAPDFEVFASLNEMKGKKRL